MNDQIKIALVDDEHLFLEGLSLLIARKKKLRVVMTCTSGSEFLNYLKKTPHHDFPEIVLIDILMKPMDGFELVDHLKKDYPNLHIIVLSSHYKTPIFGHMMKFGVSAFIPKKINPNLLYETIENVYRDGNYFTLENHKMLTSFVRSTSKKCHYESTEILSKREIEVLDLICSEYTNHEIAEKLYLSTRTIESHRHRILEKIGAKNTAGLTIYAMCNDLYTPDSKYYF